MRIAIDASTISTQGGPRTYVLGLIDALLRIDTTNDYVVFYNDPIHMGRFPLAREVVLPGKNPLARLWREHVLLPFACLRERVDLLHCPKSAVPYFSKCPVVVTIHDLIPLKHPEWEAFPARIYWHLHIPIAVRRSDFIITISDHARKEICDEYSLPAEKISVVMNGFDSTMLEPRIKSLGDEILNKYGISRGYMLYVGTIQPRKNLITLIEAYSRLKREVDNVCKLVIAGRKGWLYNELFERISTLGLKGDVVFTGFVSDEELPYIYDGASLFLYLSLSEGFGIPPLEAMACGVPVIASNRAAIPEVVGDAGIVVDPEDIGEVVCAMRRVLEDQKLAKEMSKNGRVRAGLFSWERAAGETLEIFRMVSKQRN